MERFIERRPESIGLLFDTEPKRCLKGILVEFPGDSPVFFDLGGKVIKLTDAFNVSVDKAMGDLRVAFGDAVVIEFDGVLVLAAAAETVGERGLTALLAAARDWSSPDED